MKYSIYELQEMPLSKLISLFNSLNDPSVLKSDSEHKEDNKLALVIRTVIVTSFTYGTHFKENEEGKLKVIYESIY